MPLTLATPPVHNKDTKSSKNESKLRQYHLWNGQGNVGVVIVNPFLREMLCMPLSVRRPPIRPHSKLLRLNRMSSRQFSISVTLS